MGMMQIEVPHPFDNSEAKARLSAMGDYMHSNHGINFSWHGDEAASFHGKVLAISFDGRLSLKQGAVHLEGKDPGMLLRKKAQKYLQDKLETYLDPKTPVDQLPR